MSSDFLVADIGGTNTSLAIVRYTGNAFKIVFSRRYSTQAETSLIEPVKRFLAEAASVGLGGSIDSFCISAAGPVEHESIQLTNAPWAIRAPELRERFNLRVDLINDFTAIAYAVVLLDPLDSERIIRMPHNDGVAAAPGPGMALVVGAGTGLGVGYIHKREDGSFQAFPSEGGHGRLPCSGELEFDFQDWLRQRVGENPGVELAASGQGISNIYSFLCSDAFAPRKARLSGYSVSDFLEGPSASERSLLGAAEGDRPAAIAANRMHSPRCALAMDMFVEFYAAYVSSLCAAFLPRGGVYLAGGITAKNADLLLDDARFMRTFERNYAPHMRKFLAEVPVMLVKDYSISLLGAANAALQFSSER